MTLTRFLLLIDSGYCHSVKCSDIDFRDAHMLKSAIDEGYVRRVSEIPGHVIRNVPRFVLTSGGSHYVGTFKTASLYG